MRRLVFCVSVGCSVVFVGKGVIIGQRVGRDVGGLDGAKVCAGGDSAKDFDVGAAVRKKDCDIGAPELGTSVRKVGDCVPISLCVGAYVNVGRTSPNDEMTSPMSLTVCPYNTLILSPNSNSEKISPL